MKAIINKFVIIMLIGVVLCLLVGTSSATWCNNDFAKRINVSVNNTAGSGLTDYQIYVNLSSNPINETSLRVYNASDCTLRPHWCENETGGNSYDVWINYSVIAASAWTNNTAIYYDNAPASSISNFSNTFTKDYNESGLVGLWHMDMGSGTTVTDSSGHNYNSMCKGAGEPAWNSFDGGQWNGRSDINFSTGSSLQFDGTDDYIEIKDEVFTHASSYQHTPTYDGSNQTVHPDVYYNSSGWHSWKYWMVMTPYPNGDCSYENPSILVSNDSFSWEVPSGLSNPIDPQPPSGFNSDPDIVAVGDELWVYYRWNYGDGSTSLRMRNTTNGTVWSNEYFIFNISVSGNFASPAIIYNGSAFKMWAVNTTAGQIIFYNSTDGINWNGPYLTSISPSYYKEPWHVDVVWIEEESEYWAIYNGPCDNTAGIYFLNSSDGISWQSGARALLDPRNTGWDNNILYRCTFLYNISGNGILDLWYSAESSSGSWNTGYTNMSFSKNLFTSLNFERTDPFSISAWIKLNETAGVSHKFVTRMGNTAPYRGWLTEQYDGKLYFILRHEHSPQNQIHVNSLGLLSAATWHHIVSTYNGNSSASGVSLYIDGNLQSLHVSVDNLCATTLTSTLTNIGARDQGSCIFNGTIDDVRVYNRVLSLNEIIAYYERRKYAALEPSSTLGSEEQQGTDTSFTVTLPSGYTHLKFEPSNSTAQNVTPNGQTDSQEFYNVTNTGDVNLDVRLQLNETVSDIVLKADNDNNPAGAKEVNTTLVTIQSNLATSNSADIWLWSDFSHAVEQDTNKTITINVTQSA